MSDSSPEKEHLFNLINAKYRERLTQEQLEAVSESLDRVISAVEELRKIPLENSDEPFNIFKPLWRQKP